ncbi:3,4-dihydroxy-2-butanone-4-phosphate synthase [Buchnera aphidicola]|uniref:3,4-dihydroxy-2-butanone-4-phosphate synthase n=1 Tax=Buchnera aphidicola TaxID=9 RepID=UPI003BEEC2FC
MNETLLSQFGTPIERIQNAIISLKSGNGIIILDDEKRENEGDLVFSPEKMTVEQMAFTIRNGSGIVCLCITEDRRKKLNLPMMVKKNTSLYRTAFTVTIEAAKGISTGVSAKDRLTTIKTAMADDVRPSDLNKPGHVFPLQSHPGGLLERAGHTEAAVTIVSLAGFKPAGVICELTNKDGSMTRTPEAIELSKYYNINIITIKDIILYLKKHDFDIKNK